MIYTVTFNPALDYVIGVNKLSLRTVNRTTSERIYCGGKGINVSIVLKTLGYESVALGFIAGFTGKEIEQRVREEGITTDFIQLQQGLSRINVKVQSDGETELNGQGPAISDDEVEQFLHKLDQLVYGDILVLAGSIPNSLPDDMYEKIMEYLKEKQICIVVDATKDLLMRVLKYHPFLIKPNHHELAQMFDVVIESNDDIIYYARKLRDLGARNVLISMGDQGAILIDESDNVQKMGIPKGTAKYTVGAGDSMVAGFLAGYQKNHNYKEALTYGIAAGSATAFSEGLAKKEFIEQIKKSLET